MNFTNNYVYATIMWLVAIVLSIADFKLIRNASKIKNEHNLDEFKVYDYSKGQKRLYTIFGVVAIIILALSTKDLSLMLVNLALVYMCGIEIWSSIVTMHFYYNDKAIIFDGELIRLKSIKSLKKTKKRGRNYTLTTYDGHSFVLYEDCAKVIEGLVDVMKEEKREKKKK